MTCIKLIPVLAVSLLVLGACGSNADGKKDGARSRDPSARVGPSAPLTADERACDAFYQAQIDWTHRCGGILNESQAAVTRFRTLCARELAAPGAEGLREARAKCGEVRKTAGCEEALPECDLPPGSLPEGEPCAVRAQCQSRYCKIDSGGCGKCAKAVAPGGACTVPTDCEFGNGEVASCDFKKGSTSGVCSVWKLVKPGETCGTETFCDVGSQCFAAEENATTGTCFENDDVGGGCDDSRTCKAGLACVSGTCGPRPKEGESCGAMIDDCADGFACDGTCKAVSYVDTGDECDGVRRCVRGRCVQAVTQGPNGQATPTGTAACVAPLADGASCGQEQSDRGVVCDHFARCVGGKCVFPDPARCR
jgi:hypothetical protein